jgi:hypothetical protein
MVVTKNKDKKSKTPTTTGIAREALAKKQAEGTARTEARADQSLRPGHLQDAGPYGYPGDLIYPSEMRVYKL